MIDVTYNKHIDFSPEVKEALAEYRPLIALESTIITHGMPYPQNYDTAFMLEGLCRKKGVTPATIAIYKGRIQIGLSSEILIELSKSNSQVEKVSIRDISYCLAQGKNGGTTVAATSYLAKLVGLDVFATGGIGGVHRGVVDSWDISADLNSLKENQIIVVSAGAKAILDIPKTLEVLDSYSVPVLAYKTDDFPAFYSSKSGSKVRQINSAKEIAEMWIKHKEMKLKSGFLIGNPIPSEYEIPTEQIEVVIIKALEEVEALNIKGKEVTPYLLQRLYELTEGHSLDTNIELVKNNVLLACQIAQKIKSL